MFTVLWLLRFWGPRPPCSTFMSITRIMIRGTMLWKTWSTPLPLKIYGIVTHMQMRQADGAGQPGNQLRADCSAVRMSGQRTLLAEVLHRHLGWIPELYRDGLIVVVTTRESSNSALQSAHQRKLFEVRNGGTWMSQLTLTTGCNANVRQPDPFGSQRSIPNEVFQPS